MCVEIITGHIRRSPLKQIIYKQLDRFISLLIRTLINQKLDCAILHVGNISLCGVKPHNLLNIGGPSFVYRLRYAAQARAADEDTRDVRHLIQGIPRTSVCNIMIAFSINDPVS